MRKIAKKSRLVYERTMLNYVQKIGELHTRNSYNTYRIQTKYGIPLEIRSINAGMSYCFFTAFIGKPTDYEKIRYDGITCNPFTGKWNFFFSASVDPIEACRVLEEKINNLLPCGKEI